MIATLVATSVVSGVGALPTLERSDVDGDGTVELGVGWAGLAGEAGAAASSAAAGLSCPAGMVLDGELCKTPKVEKVPVTRVCAQGGYELVVGLGELGASYSCQKTVPGYCAEGKVLHEGRCQTAITEQRDAKWSCAEGTLVSTFVDPGYSYWCRITVDPPECPNDGESYLTSPTRDCYVEVSFHEKRGYTWGCSAGTYVKSSGDHGVSHQCRITLSPPGVPGGGDLSRRSLRGVA